MRDDFQSARPLRPNIERLRALRAGESAVFEVPHNADRNVHVYAARNGGNFSTARAWLVPQHGAPRACIVITCYAPMPPGKRRKYVRKAASANP